MSAVVSVPSYTNFFNKMTKKIVDGYHVCFYVSCLIRSFFNFQWKTDMYAASVDVIVVCQNDLKIKLFYVLVGATSNLVSISSTIPWNTIASSPRIFSSFYEFPDFFYFFFSIISFVLWLFLLLLFFFFLFCNFFCDGVLFFNFWFTIRSFVIYYFLIFFWFKIFLLLFKILLLLLLLLLFIFLFNIYYIFF